MMDFAEILRREIVKQRETIDRMGDNHPDFNGSGIMGQIRAERLYLLKKLLRIYPAVDAAPESTGEGRDTDSGEGK